MKARKKRNLGAGKALLLLGAAAAVFAFRMVGQFGGAGAGAAPATAPGTTHLAEAADVAAAPTSPAQDEQPRGKDLLAAFGSFAGGEVRHVFVRPATASPARPAAPGGEPAPVRDETWSGPDPAQLHVTVILLAAASQRAVVEGKVVGIGDRVGGGKIVRVARDGIEVAAGRRTLFYELDMPWPREFRAELARRQSAAAAPARKQQEQNQ